MFQRMFIDCCCEQTLFDLKEFINKRIDFGGYQINKLNCPELDGGSNVYFFKQLLSNSDKCDSYSLDDECFSG